MTTITTTTAAAAFSNVRFERSERFAVQRLFSEYADKIGYALVREDGYDTHAEMNKYRVLAVFESEDLAMSAMKNADEERLHVGMFMKSQFVRAELNANGNQIVVYEHRGFFGYRSQIAALRIYDKTSHEILNDIEDEIEYTNNPWFEHPEIVVAQIEAVRSALIKSAALALPHSGLDDGAAVGEIVFDKIDRKFIAKASDGFDELAVGMIRSAMMFTHTLEAWDTDSHHRYARITEETEDRIRHAAQMEHRLREVGL